MKEEISNFLEEMHGYFKNKVSNKFGVSSNCMCARKRGEDTRCRCKAKSRRRCVC
ncbi:hypothetical protein P4S83_16040 [Aneurinibacillus thermoaerophilus]|uniref:hypothetical protein n=1 Tax=Aneurinibacillus thermoaerophilus TaxID=143495 RepID=UPI0030C99AB5